MRKQNLMICTVTMASMLYLFAGCNKGLSGLVPGEGQVLYDGEPLAGATVTFHPAAETSLRGAVARTDSAGKFVVMTLNPNDGIEPCEYIVTVSKLKGPSKQDDDALPRVQPQTTGLVSRPMKELPKPEHEISPKYYSKETSGLKITITPEGDRNMTFKLSSL